MLGKLVDRFYALFLEEENGEEAASFAEKKMLFFISLVSFIVTLILIVLKIVGNIAPSIG